MGMAPFFLSAYGFSAIGEGIFSEKVFGFPSYPGFPRDVFRPFSSARPYPIYRICSDALLVSPPRAFGGILFSRIHPLV